jgi:hypothetical protein
MMKLVISSIQSLRLASNYFSAEPQLRFWNRTRLSQEFLGEFNS